MKCNQVDITIYNIYYQTDLIAMYEMINSVSEITEITKSARRTPAAGIVHRITVYMTHTHTHSN